MQTAHLGLQAAVYLKSQARVPFRRQPASPETSWWLTRPTTGKRTSRSVGLRYPKAVGVRSAAATMLDAGDLKTVVLDVGVSTRGFAQAADAARATTPRSPRRPGAGRPKWKPARRRSQARARFLLGVALDPLGDELEPSAFPRPTIPSRSARSAAPDVDLRGEARCRSSRCRPGGAGDRRATRSPVPKSSSAELDASVFQHAVSCSSARSPLRRARSRSARASGACGGRSARSSACVDVVDELRVLELPAETLTAISTIAAEQLAQPRCVEAGLEQDPAADLHDQA